jgi:hypothetical protein
VPTTLQPGMELTNSHSNDHSNGVPTVKETIHNYITDLKSQLDRLPEDVGVVKSLIDGLFTENVVDDRK